MDRTKRDLEALVSSQKEQLTRYEKRLKDVVTAYKGLLKEKEALETSLAAITTTGGCKPSASDNDQDVTNIPTTTAASTFEHTSSDTINDANQLKTQIITLMNSLATLSAEKSRMEASFQADKRQLRQHMAQKDQTVAELRIQIKKVEERFKSSVDEVKAKWIIERQEREQETNNQMLMIRELQKLYADERHLKENIEMQLNNFKMQFASDEAENSRMKDMQTQLKESRLQLKQLQLSRKENNGDEASGNAAVILQQVQQEMQQLKDQHAVAIKSEQKRAHLAEERSKKLAAMHEDRVANLEARLAELSTTVGTYDQLRQQDQRSIYELKQKLQDIDRNQIDIEHEIPTEALEKDKLFRKLSTLMQHDISTIVDEIMRLKKLLISENARSANPIDISKVFLVGADHSHCQEELNSAQQQLEAVKFELLQLQEKRQVQKSHILTLQEKVKVLNRNIDEQELELKLQSEIQQQAVKDERYKWKATLTELENECRCKLYEMEQQLQKQRQRSLQLLEDKEQEIKTLQTSFEVFHTANVMPGMVAGIAAEHYLASSDAESVEGASAITEVNNKVTVKSKKLSVGENCHMLHYANEIARKDIEIAGLRKAKYVAETSLRKSILEKVTVQEDLCDKISALEEQVDRLERCKTREGANLEYLKNVIISFIVTKDADGKQHMMNAISAVLQFTSSEIQAINAAFQKK